MILSPRYNVKGETIIFSFLISILFGMSWSLVTSLSYLANQLIVPLYWVLICSFAFSVGKLPRDPFIPTRINCIKINQLFVFLGIGDQHDWLQHLNTRYFDTQDNYFLHNLIPIRGSNITIFYSVTKELYPFIKKRTATHKEESPSF